MFSEKNPDLKYLTLGFLILQLAKNASNSGKSGDYSKANSPLQKQDYPPAI